MNTEVAELITALRTGTMSLDQVAQRFRERSWPDQPAATPTSYLELAAAAQEDPAPDVPGSFDDVTAAYDCGDLSRAEYRVLAEAAADSMRSHARRGNAGPEPQ